MKAVFSTSEKFQQLIVNNMIVVRKNLQGKISLEGPLSEDYYAVRSIIYKSFVML
tara:strand:+ start:789 stop:953 length:165 start_codon:yes stop_codon:yes gene_type:complete